MIVQRHSLDISNPWREVTVDDIRAPFDTALATGPFGSSIGSQYFRTDGIPVIRGSNLSADSGVRLIDDGLVYLSKEKAAEFKRSVVRQGDLVFTCWGTINQVGLIDERARYPEYVISNKQMKLSPDPSKADSLFLYYLFSGSELQQSITNSSIGSSVPGFNLGLLRCLHFQLPPLPEQRAIAAALSDTDDLIASLERLIAKKRAVKQAAMQQLLTGKTRVPGFDGKWETKRLATVADVKTGPFGAQLHESDYVQWGTPIITVEHLGEFGVDCTNPPPMVSDKDRIRLQQYGLRTGDIAFSRVGSIDRNALIRQPQDGWLFSGRLLRVRPGAAVAPEFLSYYFHGEVFKTRIRTVAVGQTMASLNTKILNDTIIEFPSLPEQRAISTVLGDIDAEIVALEQKRDKNKALKQGMMQELLTGRIRLV
jgi:type I restriction enzyme, S subunit